MKRRKLLILSQTKMTLSGILEAYGKLIYIQMYKTGIDQFNIAFATSNDILKEEKKFNSYFIY